MDRREYELDGPWLHIAGISARPRKTRFRRYIKFVLVTCGFALLVMGGMALAGHIHG